MNTEQLIEALDIQFGSPYAPKQYLIVQEAIKHLKFLNEDNAALRKQLEQ